MAWQIAIKFPTALRIGESEEEIRTTTHWANLTQTLALPIAVSRKVCRRPALWFLLCHFIHKGQPTHTWFKLSARNDSLTESLATDRCSRRHGRFLCGD